MLTAALACLFAATVNPGHARAAISSSTIVIDATGGGCVSPAGSWDAANNKCTLLDDINFTAEPGFNITASNITLDGNGKTISPPGSYGIEGGIATNSVSGITVKNLIINGFGYGFKMYSTNS